MYGLQSSASESCLKVSYNMPECTSPTAKLQTAPPAYMKRQLCNISHTTFLHTPHSSQAREFPFSRKSLRTLCISLHRIKYDTMIYAGKHVILQGHTRIAQRRISRTIRWTLPPEVRAQVNAIDTFGRRGK